MRQRVALGAVWVLVSVLAVSTGTAQNQVPAPGGQHPGMQAPFPPLPAAHQQFLDAILAKWEAQSDQVKRYRCNFKRWEYDPVFGPRDTFKNYSEGVIKYAAPDKGMFKVEKTLHYTPPAQPSEKPRFVQREGDVNEHWICDGQSIFEHDHSKKQLIQRELPPHMRGRAIADGPLPFLFGAKAASIKQRYWIRPLAVPKDIKGEYWLEAFPKTRQDAANYQKVHVILDQTDFLPKGLVIFDRNFDPRKNPTRTTLTFDNREVNWSIALQQLNIFTGQFFAPSVPFGWKKVVEKYQAPQHADNFAPSGVNRVGAAPGAGRPGVPR